MSIIIACDVSTDIQLDLLVKETCQIPGIDGYKLGCSLSIVYGLKYLTGVVLNHTHKKIIYDHQKAGTDIPDMGKKFAEAVRASGADEVILFPFTGPHTSQAWITACLDQGLGVVVGGLMSHEGFTTSCGGYIDSHKVMSIYDTAALYGARKFVVPGVPSCLQSSRFIVRLLIDLVTGPFDLYVPGLGAQGGSLNTLVKDITGNDVHNGNVYPIVGRFIYEAADIGKAAAEAVEQAQNRRV
jgi:orotidine-5'-phosphate decarboxylase